MPCAPLLLLATLVAVVAFPTDLKVRQPMSSLTNNDISAFCSDAECEEGSAILDADSGLCICPQWTNEDPTNPCGFLQCPETTEVYFASATNQCMCKVRNITPVLIHQATDQIAQQNASVYSVQPHFLDGVISFHFQVAGAPVGFNLNASSNVAAVGIGTDPEPNLVLMPKSMKSRVSKSAEKTFMILAVTFNSDETIAYHVQLDNGTIVKLYGDKYIHDIDLIDPSEPASLSILTSHSSSRQNRNDWHQHEEASSHMQAKPLTTAKRGVEGISSYTATFSEATCQTITCHRNGGKVAWFNPFLNACYCRTLASYDSNSSDRVRRDLLDITEGPARREIHNSIARPGFQLVKPSAETCRHLIVCQGESKPYFDQASRHCLCVVYRPGIKEPVITSDSSIFPRMEQVARLEGRDTLAEENQFGPDGKQQYPSCWYDFARANCKSMYVGRWSDRSKKCICVRIGTQTADFPMGWKTPDAPADG